MISRIGIIGFRCIDHCDLEPSSGFNLVFGENGQGKTSLIESIHLASTGRIWRSSRDVSAIQEGLNDCQVKLTLSESGTDLEVHLSRSHRKRALLNGLALPRAADLMGRLPCVAFSARDLRLATGEPSDRRDFMDHELSQLYPSYLRHLTLYRRALDQRNALLRSARERHVPIEVFAPWEEPLAEHGHAMRRMRREWVQELCGAAEMAQARLGSGERLTVSCEEKDALSEASDFDRTRSDEIARGGTSLGPHRDDLRLEVQGLDARSFASQGQQRTAVIALKLAVQALAKRVFGHPPVLLLDDVFSDLDAGRRSRLVDFALEEGGQVFLTCTEAELAGEELMRRSRLIQVRSGRVTLA